MIEFEDPSLSLSHFSPRFVSAWAFLIGMFVIAFGATEVYAAYERYAPGDTAVIGEFVYDDNFVATTTASCSVTIYNPSGGLMVNAGAMSAAANGWYSYNYSISPSAPEGAWPTEIACGSLVTGDLVKEDRTFSVGPKIVSSSTISDAVWNNGSRTLTSAALTSGSLATQDDVLSASSSLANAIAGTNALVTANTSLVSGLNNITAADVWNSPTRSLTTFGTLVADIWSNPARTITGGAATTTLAAADVWSFASRTLTGASLASGSLATQDDVLSASSSLASAISGTNALLAAASSSIASSVNGNTNTAFSGSWRVSMANTENITAGHAYRAKVYVSNLNSQVDAFAAPQVTLYDVNRNMVVSGISMTDIGDGVYEYTYSVDNAAAQGAWETVVTTQVQSGVFVNVSDYWEVAGSPAQVIINSISDDSVPSVAANVTITNEGLSGYEYQYEWCVVSSIDNACGGGDDTYYGSAAKFINPSEDFNTTLTATVPTPGTYYFKLIAYFGTDSSGASRSFTAVTATGGGDTGGGDTGGGGGGGGAPVVVSSGSGTCRRADFNCDKKVNSIDFSILLYFWKSKAPFRNIYVDINKDNKVETVDFSILLYEWGK